jgi:hypothetical protein
MNNVIDIADLRAEFLEKTKLKDTKEFAEKQMQIIFEVSKQNEALRDKIDHLEKLLLNKAPEMAIRLSAEEVICIEQIEILQRKSSGRELSLDEVKRLDLLIKNLRLIREESTQVINTSSYSNVQEDMLVAIATSKQDATE